MVKAETEEIARKRDSSQKLLDLVLEKVKILHQDSGATHSPLLQLIRGIFTLLSESFMQSKYINAQKKRNKVNSSPPTGRSCRYICLCRTSQHRFNIICVCSITFDRWAQAKTRTISN